MKTVAKFITILAIFLASFQVSLAATGINRKINFQGKVVNKGTLDGTNITDGNYDFKFSLWSTLSAGTSIWSESWTSGSSQVPVASGIFGVALGTYVTFPPSVDFNSDSLYISVDFNHDGEMTPRIQMTAVPYAFNAEKVNGLNVTNTTGTLTIPNGKTITFGDSFTTTGIGITLDQNLATTASVNFAGLSIGSTSITAKASEINYLASLQVGRTGAIFFGSGVGITQLDIGTSGYFLMSSGTRPVWVSMAGLGTTYSVNNGLTMTGNVIGLGGSLTANSQIGTSNFNLSFLGLGGSQVMMVGTSGLTVGNTNPYGVFDVSRGNGKAHLVIDDRSSWNDTYGVLTRVTGGADSNIMRFMSDSGEVAFLAPSSTSRIRLYTNQDTNEDIRLDGNGQTFFVGGNVSVGTTGSGYKFEVAGDALVSTRLGIGSTNSLYALNVGGSLNATNIFQNGLPIGTGTTYAANNGLTMTTNVIGLGGSMTAISQIGTSSFSLSFLGLGGTQVLFIGNTGNVGIGTTKPTYKLEITGDALISTRLGIGSTNSLYTINAGGTVAFANAYASGNLSVGAQSGIYNLNVTGDALISTRLGIGSTNVLYAINVGGTVNSNTLFSSSHLSVANTTSAYNLNVTGDALISTRLGIGSTNSLYALNVGGSLNATNIFQNGLPLSGASYTFINGLNNNGGNVGLGGTMTANTQIGMSSFGLSFLGLGGTKSLYISSSGKIGIGTINPAGYLNISGNDPSFDNSLELSRFDRTTSGTAANGIGGYQSFNVQASNGSLFEAGRMGFVLRDADAAGTPGGEFVISTWRDSDGQEGVQEVLSAYSDNSNRWICGNSVRTDGPDCLGFTIGSMNDIALEFDGNTRVLWNYGQTDATFETKTMNGTAMKFTTLGPQPMYFDTSNDGEDIYISATGNVGIGVTESAYKLEVAGDMLISTRLGIGSTDVLYALNVGGTLNAGTIFQNGSPLTSGTTYTFGNGLNDPGSHLVGLGGTLTSNTQIGTSNYSFSFLGLGNSLGWSQTANGNVGVGTSNPGAKFEINSGVGGTAGLRFTQINSGTSTGATNNKVLTVDANGNVYLAQDQLGTGSVPSGTIDGQTLRFNGSQWEVSSAMMLSSKGSLSVGVSTADVVKTSNGTGTKNDFDSLGSTMVSTGTTAANNMLMMSDYVAISGTMSTTSIGTSVAVGLGGQVIVRSDGKYLIVSGGGSSFANIWDGVGTTMSRIAVAVGTTQPGVGAIALKRNDSRYLLIHGNNSWYSSVFDPYGQTATIAGPPICGGGIAGAGTNAFQRLDGRYVVTCGNSSRWGIYDSGVGVSGTYVAGADVGTSFGAGSHAILRDDGNFIVFQGTGGSAVWLYTQSNLNAGLMTLNPGGTGPVLNAGAFSIRMQNGKYLVLDGTANSTYTYDGNASNYGTFARQTGAGYGPTEALGDGSQSMWRPDGKYLLIIGGGSTTTNIIDVSVASVGATMFSLGPTLPVGVQQGVTSLLNNDGFYYIVRGSGTTGVIKYDMNLKMNGSYESEQINTAGHLNLSSTLYWNANSEGSLSFLVRTGTSGTIGSAAYRPIYKSGDLLGVGSTSDDYVQVKVSFTRDLPTFMDQEWGVRKSNQTRYRRVNREPTLYDFTIDNSESLHRSQFDFGNSSDDSGPVAVNMANDKDKNNGLSLVTQATYGVQSTAAFGIYAGSFSYHAPMGIASSQTTIVMRKPNGTFEVAIGTASTPGSFVYDQNNRTFTAGTGTSVPTQKLGIGALAFKRPDGKYLVVVGDGTSSTNLYDPILEKYDTTSAALTGLAGAGAQAIAMPNGRVLIVLGNYTSATSIYDPFANTMTPGPAMTGNVGLGALNIPRPDGTYLIALGVNSSCAFNQATTIFNPYTMSVATTSVAISALAGRGVGPGSMAIPRSDGSFLVVLGAGTSSTTAPPFTCAAQTGTSFYNPITNLISGGAILPSAVGYGGHAIPRADGTWLIVNGQNAVTTSIYIEGVGTTFNNFGVGGSLIPGPSVFGTVNAGAVSFQRDDGKFVTFLGGTQSVDVVDTLWVDKGVYKSEIVNIPDLDSTSTLTWKSSPTYTGISAEVKTAVTANGIQTAASREISNPGGFINPSGGDKFAQVSFNFKRTFPSYGGILTDVWSNSGSNINGITKRIINTPVLNEFSVTKDVNLVDLKADGVSVFRVGSNGNVYTAPNGVVNSGGADLAERYTSTQELEKGEVVTMDTSNNHGVLRSKYQYQPDVVGVVSSDPGFVAGSYTVDSFPIALVGRVPVKVSTENGNIRVGDRLTSSSTPGYAMRATKAGRVIGKALESLDATSLADCPVSDFDVGAKRCGTIMMFVNLTDYLGMPVETVMEGTGAQTGSDEKILDYLAANKTTFGQQTSDIFSDRVVATKIVADTIVANKIQAKQIEGLEMFTDKISSLSQKYDDMKTAMEASGSGIVSVTPTSVDNKGIMGLFKFNGQSEFGGSVVVKALSEFWDKVLFKGEVGFEKTPVMASSTAGFAIVNIGESQVEVKFDQEYKETPVVNVSMLVEEDDRANILDKNYIYWIARRNKQGFTIVLNKNAESDLRMSWMAMDVKDAKTTKNETIKISPVPSLSAGTTTIPTMVEIPVEATTSTEASQSAISD